MQERAVETSARQKCCIFHNITADISIANFGGANGHVKVRKGVELTNYPPQIPWNPAYSVQKTTFLVDMAMFGILEENAFFGQWTFWFSCIKVGDFQNRLKETIPFEYVSVI